MTEDSKVTNGLIVNSAVITIIVIYRDILSNFQFVSVHYE